jgi:hypothetical protein
MIALSLLCATAFTPAWADKLYGQFSGSSHVAFAVLKAGQTRVSYGPGEGCPCNGTRGDTRTKTVSVLDLPFLTAGTSIATASGTKTKTTAVTQQTATLENVNILGGLITADVLTAVATVNATKTQLTASDSGTTFTNLTIAGQNVPVNVADNTVYQLPGIGQVTVMGIQEHNGGQDTYETVQLLAIDVLQTNSFNLPVGAKVVIGEADAGFMRTEPAAELEGHALGTSVSGDAGTVFQDTLGHLAGIGLPGCNGTDGKTLTRSVANISVPNLISIGTITSTATGGEVKAGDQVQTTSTIANLNLLDGLLSADTITAAATSTRANGKTTGSTAGSTFANLSIAGIPVDPNTPPNTTLPLPGLGLVTITEQTIGANGKVSVVGLHVVVNTQNILGLPVNTNIRLASARADAKGF